MQILSVLGISTKLVKIGKFTNIYRHVVKAVICFIRDRKMKRKDRQAD